MRTVYPLLALFLSFLLGGLQAATLPVLQVENTTSTTVIITNGGTDYMPFVSGPTTITYTLRNTGAMPLAVHTPTLSAKSGASVTITGFPTSPIAPSGSTTMTVSVTPAGGATAWSFKVNFGSTDLTANPFTWTVKSGPPLSEISVSYDQVDVPNSTAAADYVRVGNADIRDTAHLGYTIYPVVVRNTGAAPLKIDNITVAAVGWTCSPVLLSPASFPVNVAPGTTLTLAIDVVGITDISNWQAIVTILNNDGDIASSERAYQFVLAGGIDEITGFGPESVGQVRVNSPTAPSIILINNGIAKTPIGSSQKGVASNYTFVISNMNSVGGTGLRIYFPVISSSPLTYGDAVTIVPRSTRSPGPINATASVPGQPTGPINPPVSAAGGYVIVPFWPYAFPPNTNTFTVQVTPTDEGPWSVPVTFRSNDRESEDPFTVTITGTALGVPDVSVTNRGTTLTTSGPIASLIPSAVGFTNTHSFVVKNIGSGTVLLADTIATGALTNCTVVGSPTVSKTSLGEGGTATVTVKTTPTTMAAWSATFNLTSNDPSPSPFVLTVSGSATAPKQELDVYNNATPVPNGGTATAAGASLLGHSTPYTLKLQNSGTGPLTISGASVGTLTNCTATIAQPAAFPATVAAQDPSVYAPLVVNVTPIDLGPWSVALTVTSDDADESTYAFTLSGTATKLKPQKDCGLGSGFSLLLLALVGAMAPLGLRRRR